MTAREKAAEKWEEFFENVFPEIDILNYMELDDEPTSSQDVYDILNDAGAFDAEVIYYSVAIEYLADNDPSLQESLGLASEMGYEASSLSSEILASLLKSEKIREEFEDVRDEIDEFLEDFDYDLDDEDDED